jgi:DNA helicase II / ATP-dependent DNA helicase PcrA
MIGNTLTPRFIPKKIQPTNEQKTFQTAQKRFILADANAGAAKTTTLALRIAESIYRGRSPESVLALVFTDAAKQALIAHLKAIGLAKAVVSRLAIETFDDLAKVILQKIEGTSVKSCITNEELKPHAEEALAEAIERNPSLVEGGAFNLNSDNATITQFLNLQLRIKATLSLYAPRYDVSEYNFSDYLEEIGVPPSYHSWYREYERLRSCNTEKVKFRGRFDSTYDLVCLMEDDPPLRDLLPIYSVIVADELHDLNEAAFRLLVMLIRRGNAFFSGAGDKDQVIYSWSGADPQFLRNRFQEEFPSLQIYPLTASYRYGFELSEAISFVKRKACSSALSTRTRIQVSTYDHLDPMACTQKLVDIFKETKNASPLYQTTILLRDRDQSVRVENALFQANIPYKFVGMESYLLTPEVLMLRGMVAVAMKNLHLVADKKMRGDIYEALTTFAEIHETKELIPGQNSREIISENPEFLEGFLTNKLEKSTNQVKTHATRAAVDYLRGLSAEASAGEVLRRVAETMGLKNTARRIYVDRTYADVVVNSIEGFIDVCESSGITLGGFAEWIREREAALADERASKVTISCVDHVKGLEFSHVIIPFLGVEDFPRRGFGSLEEENRFYVAITRAIDRLTLITPTVTQQQSKYVGAMQIEKAISRGKNLAQKARIQAEIKERKQDDEDS